MDKLSTYDFGAAMDKNGALEKRLTIEYEQGLLRQYGITKAELQDIQREAMSERWPFPSP